MKDPKDFGAVYGEVSLEQAEQNSVAVAAAIKASAESHDTSRLPDGIRGAVLLISDYLRVTEMLTNRFFHNDHWYYLPLFVHGHGVGISIVHRVTPGTAFHHTRHGDIIDGERVRSGEWKSEGIADEPGIPARYFHAEDITFRANGVAIDLRGGDSGMHPSLMRVKAICEDPNLPGVRMNKVWHCDIKELTVYACAGDGMWVEHCLNLDINVVCTMNKGRGLVFYGGGSRVTVWAEQNRGVGLDLRGGLNMVDAWFERNTRVNGRGAKSPQVIVSGAHNILRGNGLGPPEGKHDADIWYENRRAYLTTSVNNRRHIDRLSPKWSEESGPVTVHLPVGWHGDRGSKLNLSPFGDLLAGKTIHRGDYVVLTVDWEVVQGAEYYRGLYPYQEHVTGDFRSGRAWHIYWHQLHWGIPLADRLRWPEGFCANKEPATVRWEQIYEFGDEQQVTLNKTWPRLQIRPKGPPNETPIEMVFHNITVEVY